jgi:hypothetical protein
MKEELLSHTLQSMYRVISFAEGDEPDWDGMKQVFAPNARLTRITPDRVEHFDLASFQLMAQEMLDLGIYTGFYEHEVARRAEIFGSLAHVLSIYETKRDAMAAGYLGRGVNSIQLLWAGDSWRVLSLLWDEETSGNPLGFHDVFKREVVHG